MRKIALLVPLSILLSIPATSHAGPMKAGLWEVSMKSGDMKGMPQMSHAQMEQMKRMGISIPQAADGGMVTKVCVTPEMAAREQPQMQQQKSCQAKNMRKSGNTFTADIVCHNPELKGTGTVTTTYTSNTSFKSSYNFTGTSYGKPVKQSQESKGDWLGSDCGSVRPPIAK